MKHTFYLCLLSMLLVASNSAEGGTKEELVRLQSDVLALQNQIRSLEQTFSDQTQGLKSLVVQLNDQTGRMNLLLERVSSLLETQAEGGKSGDETVLQEMAKISVKLDDTTTRMSALAQQISDLKIQTKPLSSDSAQKEYSASSQSGLTEDAIFNQAFTDLIQGNFDLAIQGFTAYIRNFPTSAKAGDAQYNIGEAYYNQDRMDQAIAAFTRVLNDYSATGKAASSLFKRGKAELALAMKDRATADFKALVQKYPSAPEADLAKAELAGLGINQAKPAPARRQP